LRLSGPFLWAFRQNAGIGSPPSSNQEDWVVLLTVNTCPGDYNFDKDVDGEDIVKYILGSRGLDSDVLANNFGKANCP